MTITDLTITERVQRAIRNKLNEQADAYVTHVADAHDGLTRVDGHIDIAALATAAVDAIKAAVEDAETPAPVAETQAPEPVPVKEPPPPQPIPPQADQDDDDDDDDDDDPPVALAEDPVADTKKKQNKKTRRRLKSRPE